MIARVVVLIAAAIAAYTDVRSRRIPNALCGALLVAGLSLTAMTGWERAAISVGLFLGVFLFGTLLFTLRLIGGGDVKLLAAAAAALGWPDTAAVLLYTILAGGLIGFAFAIARGRLKPVLTNLRAMVFPMLSGMRPVTVPSAVGSMPYALAIFAGAATLVATDYLGLALRISL